MDTSINIDLAHVANETGLPQDKIERTVTLLDEGNTVPFITRYRKDQTGGLDEEQIRRLQETVTKQRFLADRKATILKSIESQGKLTDELAAQINSARSTKRLEDIYLPFKPKKQTLATIARQRGLEPLAREIVLAETSFEELAARATEFVRVDRELFSVDDVMQGVQHIIAERFSERSELRAKLRKILWRTGKLASRSTAPIEKALKQSESPPAQPDQATVPDTATNPNTATATAATDETPAHQPPDSTSPAPVVSTEPAPAATTATTAADEVAQPSESAESTEPPASESAGKPATAANADEADAKPAGEEQLAHPAAESSSSDEPQPEAPIEATTEAAAGDQDGKAAAPKTPAAAVKPAVAKSKPKKKKKKKEDNPFQDYFDYQEAVSKIPHHRVLAINRGERAKALRVRIEASDEQINRESDKLLIGDDHPHEEFLRTCVRDALVRLILPSLEREIRRELTERAEGHAINVFARNLRSLLLQPPVQARRVLAIDPGYRSGCKYTALDEFGNVLGHGVLHIVGKEERRKQGRAEMIEMIKTHDLSVIAIGNGTACRETERLVAGILSDELQDTEVAYVIVNEAGASVYSTSPAGREELPSYDAVIRSAISIGRRLLDPLSELVKINPANIGVGLYQHDVKAKHLQDSLDAVVESCVNYVGVDVNTASPALLRYVSGLNQLTARRLCEHRLEHGPFKNRSQLKDVAGFGDATFVQSAGFLKINGADNPLDATWIHPESYEVARRVLDKLGKSLDNLVVPAARPQPPPPSPTPPQESAAPTETEPPVSVEKAPAEAAAPPTAPAAEDQPPPTAEVSSEPVEALAETAPAPPESTPVPVVDTAAQKELAETLAQIETVALAKELEVGELLLSDIVSALSRPGRDPREDLPPPVFRRGIVKLEDLEPGLELTGTVLNVVDFGAFVDIGLKDSGLVHISRLANKYVEDPHQVVSVGDVLKVWVVEVDKDRRRVSLTAIKPGTEQPQAARRDKQSVQKRGQKPTGEKKRSGRPPRRGDKPQGGRRPKGAKRETPRSYKPKAKPKPVKPITDAMKEGKEPMRSFSDLAQFFKKEDEPGDESPEKK